MRILCTFPGRYGDLIWSLATVRALSEAYGQPVDFVTSQKYGSITNLVAEQPYIQHAWFDPAWQVEETAPMTPRKPPGPAAGYDVVYHLGYEGWPEPTLAEDIYYRAVTLSDEPLPLLDLDRPWITVEPLHSPRYGRPLVWVGWSEEHFELKVGLLLLLALCYPQVSFRWLCAWSGRYCEAETIMEGQALPDNLGIVRANWQLTATLGAASDCYLGCLSAAWCLANALGKPTVIMEPAEARWHPVFWRDSPKNHLVRGNDGRPTFDARHVGDVLGSVLRGKGLI